MRTSTRLANDSWEALLQAHAIVMKRFIADDDWGEVSMREYDVLYTLAKEAGPIRLWELNDRVLLSQPALSRMVDRMVTAGLVHRETDPNDARGVLLSLTETGKQTQRRVGRRHARSVTSAMTERLGTDDLMRLEEICLKLAGGES